MSDRRKIFIPLAVLAAGVLAATVIVRARPEVAREAAAVPPPLVRVVQVEPRAVSLDVRSQGTVGPRTESTLVAEVRGRIRSVSPAFAEGGFFHDGQVLVAIDPRDYEVAVSRAEAELARARVALEREQAEADVARQEWAELGEGEPSPLTTREPQLAEARAALLAAEANLEQARLDLERTRVQAPFEGRVRTKLVDLGQYVTPGTRLAELYATDVAEVRLPVPKPELGFLDIELGDERFRDGGLEVELVSDLGGEPVSWPARVVRAAGELDPRTRMLDLFAVVDDPFGRRGAGARPPLPMGLFVDATIRGRAAADVVVLPRAALRDGDRVLVVDGGDRLRFRPVRLLRVEGDEIVVAAGLDAGELVCVSPLETVVDGMRVRTVLEGGDIEAGVDEEQRL